MGSTALVAFVPQAGGKLAEWGLTLQSSLDQYWEQAALHCHTRSEKQQAACRRMADIFDDKQGATTIEMMLALRKHQAEECLEAGGGSLGWVNSVEFNCGLRFQPFGGAPDSAAHAVTKEKDAKLKNRTHMSKFDNGTTKSLGQMLVERFPKTEGVPALPMAIKVAPKQTVDPSSQCAVPLPRTHAPAQWPRTPHRTCCAVPLAAALTAAALIAYNHLTPCHTAHHRPIVSNDCKRVIAEIRKWLFVEFNKVNYDEEGCRLIGQAVHAEFTGGPAPRNGKSCPWWKKIYNAGNNGRNHAVSTQDTPPSLLRLGTLNRPSPCSY